MTNEALAAIIAGFSTTAPKDTLQEKIDKLNERTAEKVNKFATPGNATELGYTPDVLKGMYDADTVTTQNLQYSREIDPYGKRYDAVETKHGDVPYDMQGLSKSQLDADEKGKSTYAMQMQRQQVARVFGKPVDQVTEQDMIDVANQQQVQKLADLARVPGEERWIAPLAVGSAPINLTGSYVDEFGQKQDSSLNVPILSKKMQDIGNRGGAVLGNMANEEVSAQAALDPLQNAFATSAPKTDAQRRELLDKIIKEQNTSSGGMINAVKAFAYTLGEGVVNTLDLVPEIAQYAYGNIVGDKKWADSKGLYDTKESEAYKTWLGYNDEVVNALGKETVEAAKGAWEKGNYWELLSAMGKAAVTPELLATSLGYVAGMVLPGGLATKALQMTSKVGKTANAIKAADATGKMTKGEALLQAEDTAGDGYKILKTMTDNVGFASEAEQFGRDAEALYKETYKEEMPIAQRMIVRPMGLLYAKLDALTAKAILMGKDPVAKAIPEMVNILPEAMQATVIGKMATLAGTTAAKAAGAFGLEGSTEAIQTAMEKVAGEYKSGEVGIGDVLEKEKYEIAGAGLMGGVGGNQMQIAGKIPGAVMATPNTIKKGVELATETPDQKITRQNVEFSTPLKNEAVVAALSGNASEVADRAEKVHGKLSSELDESAPKTHTYGKILKDALAAATKAGDETAINNVYKTIAALDKDETVEFSAKDMVNESAYAKTQELIKLINQNTDTTDSKMQELKGEVGAEIGKDAGTLAKSTEIQALKDSLTAMKNKLKYVMGTDEMDPILEPLIKVENTAKEYLEGTKTLDDVNKEFAELGFMDTAGKADPSRPGLATYEKELTDQLLNTKTNKNLLKVGKGTPVVKLTGLTGFAQSRLDKLNARGTKDAYQTPAMITSVKAENEKMLKTIANILKVAKGLKNVDEETRKSYEAELATAANAAIESSKELDRRNAIIATAVKPEGVAGALAFQVDAKGESIQAVTYKDGKPIKVKIADVVDGKVVPIEKYTETKVEVVEPVVEVKEPVETVVEINRYGTTNDKYETRNYNIAGGLGHAQVRVMKDGTAYISDIQIGYDENAQRGKGLGTKAYSDIAEILANENITLESTRWNKHKSAISPQALRIWNKLVESGKAEITGTSESKIYNRETGEEEVVTIPEFRWVKSKDTKVEVVKEQDLSNLTKKQQEFMTRYKTEKIKFTAGLTRKYNELMEKAKQPKEDPKPKVKKESRGRKIKAAAEIRIGEGDDEAAARVKAMFKTEDEVKTYSESLSDEDLVELTRLDEEAKVAQEKLDKEAFQKFSDSVDEIANRPEDTEETAPVEPNGALKKVHKSLQGVIIMGNSGIGKSYAKKLYENIVDGDDLFVQAVNTVLLKYGQQASSIDSVRKMRDVFTLWGQYGKDEVKKIEAIKRRDEVYAEYARLAKTAATEGNTVLSSSARPDILENAKIAIIQTDPETIAKNRASSLRDNQEEFNLEEANNKIKSFKEKVKDLQQIELSPGMYISDILATGIPTVKSPLATVRESIAKVDVGLSQLIAGVEDMDVKRHVKEHYAKKLGELKADRTRLGKMIYRLEAVMAKRWDRKNSPENGTAALINALLNQIDKLAKSMIAQLERLDNMLKTASKEYKEVTAELNSILAEINAIEAEYTSKPVKTTIGTMVKIDEKLYGKPVVEVDGKRVAAERQLTKKGTLEAPATAINRALETLKNEKMDEIRIELKDMEKGKTSLGAKLLGRLLINFPMNNPIHKILKRGEDSVFGQLTGNTFAKADRLLEVLPKGFKDFFIIDAESKQALLDNFATMAEYVKNTKVGDIVIGKNRIAKNIDQNGLIMLNVEKDGKTYNFPVDVIELLGTVVDGKLQLDEQTQNILKFYSAKMLVDTQKMVGLILSLDESEMGQVLGIYDAEEQLKVKQEAMEGYINSASIRKDIGDEVYQALGLKFNELAPEFTVESFKSAIGILVQAIAIENGSMERKKGEAGGKNQNLIKTNWDTLTVERDALTKAIAKLQYLNENRNRPLPGLKKPADNNRVVMNTQNPVDEKSSAFLNKQEKIAYKISPRLARWLAMDEAEVLKAMGYMDVKNAGLHVSEIDAQMARNDKLVREWEILKTFAKATGNKKFYLKWGQTVSGRFTILNDLNYQESKLHREFVVAEGSTESVDVNDKDARQMLEASILQGLDMDPDKLSPETASAKFNDVFKVTDKGIEVAVEGPIKTAYEAMRDGKVNAEAMAEVFADSEGHHGISSIELLVAWDEAIKSGKKLETHANLEIDAITSGMILTLLQIGSNKALEMAEKGGIYTAKRLPDLKKYVEKWLPGVTFTPGALIEAGKKHAAEIEGKMKTAKGAELVELRKQLEDDAVFKDLYSTIGVAMIGEVQAYKEKLMGLAKPSQSQLKQLLMLQQIGELNLKNIRSIAKSPVMVYIYGATVSSIKKKLTYSLGVDTLVKALKNASKLLKDGKDASAEMNFINGFLPENEWKFVNEFGAKIEKPTEMWEQLLAVDINGVIEDIGRVINATFGKAIELAFDSRLGFVNKNRDAAKSIEMLVFQAYQIRLADAITKHLDMKYGQGRHKGESYKLSKDDMQDINQKLTEQGYGHNIVWYEDGETINQTLNKTDTKGGKYSSSVTVGKTKVGGQIKQFKPAVNTGAAPTISIHAIDGRMMMDVLNREIGGKYTGGNIYDAVVLSVNKAMLTDTADSYNTNMIETGFSRSVIADQLTMLEGMFYTKDEAGNKQFDEAMFNRVLASIGLRPEGELRDDYTKEANRIGLSTGKMLESLVRAEKINGERLTNSGKEFHSGHLYQMGSGVVKVGSANTRAKKFPVIDTIKRLLQEKVIADRKITHEEFAKAGVELHKDTDYVLNLADLIEGKTQIKSNANLAQMTMVEGKFTITDKLWDSLSSADTVQILGTIDVENLGKDEKYWYKEMIKAIEKSGAKVIEEEKAADPAKVEFNKLPKYTEGQKTMTYAGIGSRETPAEILALMTKAAQWLEAKGYKLRSGGAEGADKAFENGVKSNKEIFKGFDKTGPKEILIAHEIHPDLQGAMDYTAAKKVKTKLKEGATKVEAEKAGERSAWAVQNLMARNTNQVFGAKLDTPVDFVLFYAEETKGIRPKGGTGQAVEMARLKGIPTINMADSDWREQLTNVLKRNAETEEKATQKQEDGIITPSEVVRNNINKKIKC